jgi:lipopolysaccharide export system protein LptA
MNQMYQLKKFLIALVLAHIAFFLQVMGWAKEGPRNKVTYRADKLEGGEKVDHEESYKQLVGNVIFQHDDFTIFADSVQYFDKKDLVTASGNLKLIDRGGGVMVAGQALYDLDSKVAKLLDGVYYQQDTLSFYAEALEYGVENKVSYFRQGVKMIQYEDQLISKTGCYDQKNKLATFGEGVILLNKDYHLFCDSLLYRTDSQLAEFMGPTKIVSQAKDKVTITTYVGGIYNTRTQYALFRESSIDAEKYSVYGRLIEANPEKKCYSIVGEACFNSKEYRAALWGDYAYYQEDQGIAEVYGNPLLEKIADKDTLYVIADTLRMVEQKQDEPGVGKSHQILAYNNVKIYNDNLQGVADSMAYHSIDSTVYFYNHPVFWSHDTQLTAEEVRLLLLDDQVEKMSMSPGAFIIGEDVVGNYNQIKGREMVAFFRDNKIDHIDIVGNGEALYFALDSTELVGMNYIKCSHMRLDMSGEGEEGLKSISFFVKPIGTFYPQHKVVDSDRRLSDFSWRASGRPTLDLFLDRKPSSTSQLRSQQSPIVERDK